jgi:thiamine-monophosphate kinase
VELGLALRDIAHACIDVSDGFAADLGHILERSGTGAEVEFESLPLSPALKAHEQEDAARNCILAGGDDYELIFTASPDKRPEINALSTKLQLPITRVGHIISWSGRSATDDATRLSIRRHGEQLKLNRTGFDHFGTP